jgi:Ca2+-binding EF-hand superfamily protein
LARKGIHDVRNGNVSLKVSVSDEDETLMEAATQIFNMIDVDGNGTISVEEAERIVLHLNSRLSRSYGEIEVKSFFEVVSGGSVQISRAQFLSAFRRLSNEL